jgi:ankyrin repeat protein
MSESPQSRLLIAIKANDVEKVAQILDEGVDLNEPLGESDLPIIVATWAKSSDVVRLLLQRGSNPNVFDTAHRSPGSIACALGLVAIFRLLVDNGFNLINTPHEGGMILPVLAALSSPLEILDVLKECGADFTVGVLGGRRPSQMAAYIGRVEVLEWFEKSGYEIDDSHLHYVEEALNNPSKHQREDTHDMLISTRKWLRRKCASCTQHGATLRCSRCIQVSYCK